jgi:hypothetical protein
MMINRAAIGLLFVLVISENLLAQATKVTIDENLVTVINGKKIFTIGFTLPPAPDAKAWNGKPAYEELRDAGAVFMRTGPSGNQDWDDDWIAREQAFHAGAAKAGMYCLPWLKELSAIDPGDKKSEERLRQVVRMFKDSPGLAFWKGEDEPQWGQMNSRGKKTPAPLITAYNIIKEEDQDHPVWIVQAPRGTINQLKPYNATHDVAGVDIYPISYPQGLHVPKDANKELSMVGDYTRKMITVVENKKPVWLTLQIAWSGVSRPGQNTLRFPTFPEERFMTYDAIINGARGLIYFGGSLAIDMNEADKALGWNWTFWRRVLRPVIEEVGDKGPLAQALVQPNSKLPIKAKTETIELCAREVGGELFILAACKDPRKTEQVEITGLPKGIMQGEVLFEEPRKITAKDGKLTDWFAPWEVHVYKFKK